MAKMSLNCVFPLDTSYQICESKYMGPDIPSTNEPGQPTEPVTATTPGGTGEAPVAAEPVTDAEPVAQFPPPAADTGGMVGAPPSEFFAQQAAQVPAAEPTPAIGPVPEDQLGVGVPAPAEPRPGSLTVAQDEVRQWNADPMMPVLNEDGTTSMEPKPASLQSPEAPTEPVAAVVEPPVDAMSTEDGTPQPADQAPASVPDAQPEPALTTEPMTVISEATPEAVAGAVAPKPDASTTVPEEPPTEGAPESAVADATQTEAGSAPVAAEEENPSLIRRLLGLVDL